MPYGAEIGRRAVVALGLPLLEFLLATLFGITAAKEKKEGGVGDSGPDYWYRP